MIRITDIKLDIKQACSLDSEKGNLIKYIIRSIEFQIKISYL